MSGLGISRPTYLLDHAPSLPHRKPNDLGFLASVLLGKTTERPHLGVGTGVPVDVLRLWMGSRLRPLFTHRCFIQTEVKNWGNSESEGRYLAQGNLDRVWGRWCSEKKGRSSTGTDPPGLNSGPNR